MREILFKAKRIDNGEWVYGNYAFCDCYEKQKHYIFQNKPLEYAIDVNTICQYTGLTDKNGNKIWENDVVKYHFGDDVAPIKFGKYMSCFDSTKTAHIGFYVDWDDSTKPLRKDLGYWVNMIDCNVIGNIFDNPELLKGGASNE